MPGKKDPNKPKGRISAYAFFVQDKKLINTKEGISMGFKEFSRSCAADWKELDNDGKKKFHKLAEKDRERYIKEMESYQPPPGADGGGRRQRKKRDKNLPKRSL